MPVGFAEREEHGASPGELAAVSGDELGGLARLDHEQWGHRWAGDDFPRTDTEFAGAGIAQGEPAGPFLAEVAVAIEDEHVLIVRSHGRRIAGWEVSPESGVRSPEIRMAWVTRIRSR